MATQYWIGATSTDATVASNWRSGSVPAAGDNIIFAGSSAQNSCKGDLTNGGTIYLGTITVDTDFYVNYYLGSSTDWLIVAMREFHFNVPKSHYLKANVGAPNYVFFKEPSGSDTNLLLTIDEKWGDYGDGDPAIPANSNRRHYNFKGYVKNVKIPRFVGTGFTADGMGNFPSLRWTNPDENSEQTGFSTFSMTGAVDHTVPAIPDNYIAEIVQIGPWGSNPVANPDMDFKWTHCAKIYLNDLGTITCDGDNTNNKYTHIHLFNEDWTPVVPQSFECVNEDDPLAGIGSFEGTDRSTGSITFGGAVPSNTDYVEITDADSTDVRFIYTTTSGIFSGEPDANDYILINVNGLTTASAVATATIDAINSININNQKTLGGKSGTKNQYWAVEAYNDPDSSNSHIVRLRSKKGGAEGNNTITSSFTDTSNTVAGMSSGTATASTGDPYAVPITIEKLIIDSNQDGQPTARGGRGYEPYSCPPVPGAAVGATRGLLEAGFVYVYSPSEIDRLEMESEQSGSGDQSGAHLMYKPLSSGEYHIIHDGYYNGGYIDVSSLDPGTFVVDNGIATAPTGGLQWRASIDAFPHDSTGNRWSQCWAIDWPHYGCEIFIDAADLEQNNPEG
jgi:hypothetical protein